MSQELAKVRDSSCTHCYNSHKMTKLHNFNMYSEDLGQSHADSLVVSTVSVSPYESRLIGFRVFLWCS